MNILKRIKFFIFSKTCKDYYSLNNDMCYYCMNNYPSRNCSVVYFMDLLINETYPLERYNSNFNAEFRKYMLQAMKEVDIKIYNKFMKIILLDE